MYLFIQHINNRPALLHPSHLDTFLSYQFEMQTPSNYHNALVGAMECELTHLVMEAIGARLV
jgi:hypothetical protein